MSRSGYTDDCENLAMWRGAVASAIRGRRGQALLRETLAALDAMPVKELARNTFEADGQFCTLGVVGAQRGISLKPFIYGDDPEYVEVNHSALAKALNVSSALVQEVMYENDEIVDDEEWITVPFCGPVRPGYPDWGRTTMNLRVANPDADSRRWHHMREWVALNIREVA